MPYVLNTLTSHCRVAHAWRNIYAGPVHVILCAKPKVHDRVGEPGHGSYERIDVQVASLSVKRVNKFYSFIGHSIPYFRIENQANIP